MGDAPGRYGNCQSCGEAKPFCTCWKSTAHDVPKRSDLDLDAITAAADDATPGPWWIEDAFGGVWVVDNGGGVPGGLSGAVHPATNNMPGVVLGNVSGPDAVFIARSREWVPALVGRVRELETALAETADELSRHGWGDLHYGETPQNQRVVAAVENARRVLAGDVEDTATP